MIQEGSRTSRPTKNTCITLWEPNNCIVVLKLCKSMVGCLTCLCLTKPSSPLGSQGTSHFVTNHCFIYKSSTYEKQNILSLYNCVVLQYKQLHRVKTKYFDDWGDLYTKWCFKLGIHVNLTTSVATACRSQCVICQSLHYAKWKLSHLINLRFYNKYKEIPSYKKSKQNDKENVSFWVIIKWERSGWQHLPWLTGASPTYQQKSESVQVHKLSNHHRDNQPSNLNLPISLVFLI